MVSRIIQITRIVETEQNSAKIEIIESGPNTPKTTLTLRVDTLKEGSLSLGPISWFKGDI